MQPEVGSQLADELDPRFRQLERLIHLFKPERMVHLAATSISLVILLITAAIVIKNGHGDYVTLGGFFGSTGVVGYSASRLLRMWDQSLQLLVSVTDKPDSTPQKGSR